MKLTLTKLSLIAVHTTLCLSLLLTTACKKEAETTPTPTGPITKPEEEKRTCLVSRIEKNPEEYSTYQYDQNNRLTTFFESQKSMGTVMTFNSSIQRDQQKRIKRIVTALQGGFAIREVFYNDQGRWVKTDFFNAMEANQSGTILANLIPQYNEQGLVSKVVEAGTSNTFSYTHTYEYSNGDPIRAKRFESTCEYEYYLDKEVEVREIDLVNLYRAAATSPVGYIPSGTTPPKHLLKKISSKGKTIAEYSYDFNEHGYPTKVTVIASIMALNLK